VKTYLYRHFNGDGELLYVGISLNALNRLGQHKEHSHWFETISRVHIEKYETRESALEAETLAIRNEKPKYNIRKNMGPDRGIAKDKRSIFYGFEFSREELTGKIVKFDAIYTKQDAAKLLNLGISSLQKLIDEKKIGSIILPPKKPGNSAHGRPYKPQEVISGWQIITFLETLHEGGF